MSNKKEKTKYYSWKIGEMAKGCQYCVKGEKSVFFITGLCSNHCFYCPISDMKKNKDVNYINEMPTQKEKEIIEEIKLCGSKGVGITGGDPLAVHKRAVVWIKRLKKEFGKEFHVHLYTPLNIVTEERLRELNKAGLDEIRFHPSLEDKKIWKKLEIALMFKWDVGVEIPAMPKHEKITKDLIDYIDMINNKKDYMKIKSRISFINLNELEIADNKFNKLIEKGYKTKNELSYAVKGSEEMALGLMDYIIRKKMKINVHYCTATLKDKVQMAKRIRKRAESIALKFDKITPQGTLIRGALYLDEIKPDFGYAKRIREIGENERKRIVSRLNYAKKRFGLQSAWIDTKKLRMVADTKELRKKKNMLKKEGYAAAIVEEYPTYDGFIVELEYL